MSQDHAAVCTQEILFSAHTPDLRYKLEKSLSKKACIVLFVMLACMGFTVSFAFAVDINSCMIISSPGTYTLTAIIIDSSATRCIEITSSNVTLEGNGKTIDEVDTPTTYGVYVYNSSARLTNISIRNLILRNWEMGVYLKNVDDSTVESCNSSYNQWAGVYLQGSNNNTIMNSTVNTNSVFGLSLYGSSPV